MKTESIKLRNIDLSYFEKFVLNTIFILILGYIFSIGYYGGFLIMNELRSFAAFLAFLFILVFFILRIRLFLDKSALLGEGKDLWCFYKRFKKYTFENSEISSIKKSCVGLYSSFVITVQNKKLRIPAEMNNLEEFISGLSQHLSKEQISDLIEFHRRSLFVCFEMEKKAKVLRILCFFIPPVAFFIAGNVWECFTMVICLLWMFLSLVFPLFWSVVHWFLLKVTVSNFVIFARISTVWAIFGALLYMAVGIIYRKFYLWMIYYYRV